MSFSRGAAGDGRGGACAAGVRVAVVRFPGVNCEEETRRAVLDAGAACDIVMWNEPDGVLGAYDAYVLPGGFSYQDRVRAGAIAAKDRVVGCLAEQAAAGKPVLGICNGAQILVEAGLVPGLTPGRVEMALARNAMPDRDGYYTRWTHLRVESACSAASLALAPGDVVPVPVAHAEGRFVSATPGLVEELFARGLAVMTYATPDGARAERFPDVPNGSAMALAAVSNPAGNVVAMMPHPERAVRLGHVPANLAGTWGKRRRAARTAVAAREPGPGAPVVRSLVEFAARARVR
ncbi:MAG: phosphoribosylformylglycinamidine synthase I [Candidatus Eisenbacteria bacterium]|nr:phosphoribosylformylglycinamidine synthase I [Candidatus Eisenbacteria bacterium]